MKQHRMFTSLESVDTLEEFGRQQLSKNFFMREFLYSEISQVKKIRNIPGDPKLAIEVGKRLCAEVLEPIQERFGRISIRSAYRSSAVNARGAKNKNEFRCSSNKSNAAGHIWDVKDADGCVGATACVVVPSFLPYYERTKNWQALAWWVHDNVRGYADMEFYPKLAAFNVSWHERPTKTILSYITPRGYLTKPGMRNHDGSHDREYQSWLTEYDAQG
jgi:hypothetical protein